MATAIQSESTPDGGHAGIMPQLVRLARLAIQPRVAAMIIARGAPVIAWIGFLTYNSILVVRVLGGTPPDAGLLAAVGALAYAASASQAGRVTAFFNKRLPSLIITNVMLAVGLGIMAYAPSIPIALAGIAFAGAGFGITMSLYRSIITGLAPPALRGGVVSLAESFGRLTGTLTPVLMAGVVGAVAPMLGFGPAVRLTTLGVGIVAGGGGIVCLLVANISPHPRAPS